MILVIQGAYNPHFTGKITVLFREAAKIRAVGRGAQRESDGVRARRRKQSPAFF